MLYTKPSDQCKAAGLDSLAEMVRLTGENKDTLIKWHKNKQQRFQNLLVTAVEEKKKNEQ